MSASLFEESEGVELQTEMPIPVVAPGEVLLGILAGIDENGSPLIGFPQFPQFESVTALATIPVLPQHMAPGGIVVYPRDRFAPYRNRLSLLAAAADAG
jgi:hypothetical protein